MCGNEAAHVAADIASKFDSRIITFLVGSHKVRFRCHADVLRQAQAGDFLSKAFCDGFRETKELPNDGPSEFQFFVNSLYRVWTEATECSFKCEGIKVSQKLKLYAFAHKYACHDFQNAIVSSIYHSEARRDWRDAICNRDLERLVADVPHGSPMHRLLTDWLVKDMFDMHGGINHIADEFLEALPEFLVRAALKHMLTYSFPRSLNKKTPLKMKAQGKYMLPEDNQVRETSRPSLEVQSLSVGDADNTVPSPRPPAGGWRHASAPPPARNIINGRGHSVHDSRVVDLCGADAGDTAKRPPKRRGHRRGSSAIRPPKRRRCRRGSSV